MILRTLSAVGAALVAAAASTACCAPPILAAVLGTGMSGLGGQLEPFRPHLMTASAASFALGFIWIRRHPQEQCDGEGCDACSGRKTASLILTIGAITSALLATYPTWRTWL